MLELLRLNEGERIESNELWKLLKEKSRFENLEYYQLYSI